METDVENTRLRSDLDLRVTFASSESLQQTALELLQKKSLYEQIYGLGIILDSRNVVYPELRTVATFLDQVDFEQISKIVPVPDEIQQNWNAGVLKIAELEKQQEYLIRLTYSLEDEMRVRVAQSNSSSEREKLRSDFRTRNVEIMRECEQLRGQVRVLLQSTTKPVRRLFIEHPDVPEKLKLFAISGYLQFVNSEDSTRWINQQWESNNEPAQEMIAQVLYHDCLHDLSVLEMPNVFERINGSFPRNMLYKLFLFGEHVTESTITSVLCQKLLQSKIPESQCVSGLLALRDGFLTDISTIDIPDSFIQSFFMLPSTTHQMIRDLSTRGMHFHFSSSENAKEYEATFLNSLRELPSDNQAMLHALESIAQEFPGQKSSFWISEAILRRQDKDHKLILRNNPYKEVLSHTFGYEISQLPDAESRFAALASLFEKLMGMAEDQWKPGIISECIKLVASEIRRSWENEQSEIRAYGYIVQPMDIYQHHALLYVEKLLDSSSFIDNPQLFAEQAFTDVRTIPSSESIRVLHAFVSRFSEDLSGHGEIQDHQTRVWNRFAGEASDIFRYKYRSDDPNWNVRQLKESLPFALEAVVQHMEPCTLRDERLLDIVIALTIAEISQIDLATQVTQHIDDPQIRQDAEERIVLERQRKQSKASESWKLLERIKRKSAQHITFFQDLFGLHGKDAQSIASKQYNEQKLDHQSHHFSDTGLTEEQVVLEAEKVRNSAFITINRSWGSIQEILINGRIKSIWEVQDELNSRNTEYKGHYEERRDLVERVLGNRATGGINDPHPIYGCAGTNNGRDEFFGGAGGGYGECWLKLKTEKVKDRTSFIFDDSFDGFTRWMVSWNEMPILKAIHNLVGKKYSRHGYVEAHILGGVTIEDIDEVCIPSTAFEGKNSNGHGELNRREVEAKIESLRQQFPMITFKIVEVPHGITM